LAEGNHEWKYSALFPVIADYPGFEGK